jgi:hypothetical protein
MAPLGEYSGLHPRTAPSVSQANYFELERRVDVYRRLRRETGAAQFGVAPYDVERIGDADAIPDDYSRC